MKKFSLIKPAAHMIRSELSALCSLTVIAVCGFGSVSASARPARRVAYEPVAPPAEMAASNLFLKASTRAGEKTSRPGQAVNGNINPGNGWTFHSLPAWHTVDMGQSGEIASLRVRPCWMDGRVYQYKIEGSLNGDTWTLLVDQRANNIPATPEGDGFFFEPVRVRYIRTTFLDWSLQYVNGPTAKEGGGLIEIEGFPLPDNPDLRGGVGTVDRRYPPSGPLDLLSAGTGIEWTAWRGERVNAHVVVTSDFAHEALRFDPVILNGPEQISAQARFVRYTLADGTPQGDILDDAAELDLAAGANRPIWVSIDIPGDAPPGVYNGRLTVRSNRSEVHFPIRLEVLPAVLPPPHEWAIHLDLWQHPQAVARWHDVPAWSNEHFALMKPAMIRLAEAGQKTITCSIIYEPWREQTYDRYPSMIQWIKSRDGKWTYDYTIFDRWVGFMTDEAGLDHARIHCYSMLPWLLSFRYYDEAKQAYVDVSLEPGTDEYDAYWGSFLRDFVRHLREKGWLDRTRIAMDERRDEHLRGALATLQRHAPELKVVSAISHMSVLTRDIDDISLGFEYTSNISLKERDERRMDGKKTTFYVCTDPLTPNNFTFSPPAESEWLPLFASANRFDGFLRWAYHSWVENPLVSTDFSSWPSGDCFLVYPGDRSSIRFERLRNGIESFEKIRLLREWAAARPSPEKTASLEALDKILTEFTMEQGGVAGRHADDVRRVNEAILHAARLIADPQAD